MEFLYRNLTASDNDLIISVGRQTFGNQFCKDPEDYFKWKYVNLPGGPARGLVALSGSDVAGAYSVIPMRFLLNGRVTLGACSFDTMISPQYQRRGLFIKLASELYRALGKDGFNLVYGFPNKNSFHGLTQHLGWKRINSYHTYIILTSVDKRFMGNNLKRLPHYAVGKSLAAIHAAIVHICGLSVRDVSAIHVHKYDEELHNIWIKSDKTQWPYCLIRDGDFLKWRFFDNPEHEYHTLLTVSKKHGPIGYAVFKIADVGHLRTATLMDYNTVSTFRPKQLGIIFKAYLALCDFEDVNALVFYTSQRQTLTDPFGTFFQTIGWRFSRKREVPFCIKPFQVEGSCGDAICNAKFWHITPADMDWF